MAFRGRSLLICSVQRIAVRGEFLNVVAVVVVGVIGVIIVDARRQAMGGGPCFEGCAVGAVSIDARVSQELLFFGHENHLIVIISFCTCLETWCHSMNLGTRVHCE
jgi:hypothetical protein